VGADAIPTRDEIAAAHARIRPHVRRTPLLRLEAGALGLDLPIVLKLEHLQVTGSFKVRGAFNNLLSRAVPPAGIVAASGGNHGAAVAHAATALGHRCVVYVPEAIARPEKLDRMRRFGAEVIVAEGSVADVMVQYAAHAESTGALAVHPYDTAPTLCGQGTVAREIAQEAELDTLIVSTGGGGLIGGVAAWHAGRARIVSAETEGTATLARTLAEGPGVTIQPTGIAAGSLGGPSLGVLPAAVVAAHVSTACVVSDAEVLKAGRLLWDAARLVVEPAAAVTLAALTSGAYRPEPDERVGLLMCGGNVDPAWMLAQAPSG
jgi:threonine dehydratase